MVVFDMRRSVFGRSLRVLLTWNKVQRGILGVSSAIAGTDKHVLFADIDENWTLKRLGDRIAETQKRYDLSDVYIMRTRRGWHIAGNDAMSVGEVVDAQKFLGADMGFILAGVRRGSWCLRESRTSIADNPRIITVVPRSGSRQLSLPHLLWMTFKVPAKAQEHLHALFKTRSLVGGKTIRLVNYTKVNQHG
jgi:hypothetical protein